MLLIAERTDLMLFPLFPLLIANWKPILLVGVEVGTGNRRSQSVANVAL